MEFDNDKIIRHPQKMEVIYWVLVFLFYPLINFFTFFSKDIIFLPILVVINLLIFPCYFLYAKTIIPAFLFTKRYEWFGFISLAFYFFIHLFLMFIYSFFHLDENPLKLLQSLQPYFTYTSTTVLRESLWFFVNIFFAINIE